MSYETIAYFIKIGGTVFFFAIFIAAFIYALWPANKPVFDRAASMPLDNDDHPQL